MESFNQPSQPFGCKYPTSRVGHWRLHVLLGTFCVFALFLSASCRGDDSELNSALQASDKGSLIDFSVLGNDVGTRVNDGSGILADSDDITEMSVFAAAAVGDWDANSATPEFMFNRSVTKNLPSGQWTYSPLMYWPALGSTLSFFAVTPLPSGSGNGVELATTATTKGFPALRVTPPARPAQQVDLCLATAMNRTSASEGGKVSLAFNHALAQITFAAKYSYEFNDSLPEVYVEKIELSGLVGSNIVRFTDLGYAWDTPAPGAAKGYYLLSVNDNDLTPEAIPRHKSGDASTHLISTPQGTLCLLPQTISGNHSVRLKVTFRIYDVVWTIEKDLQPGEWKAGEHYRYNLLIETDGKVWNYGIKSAMQEFSAPLDGNYRLEAWGGHGGRYRGDVDRPWHYDQPLGSYARGCKAMVANEKLYVCVGSKGTDKITGWGVTGVAGGTNPGGGNGGKGGNSRSNGFFPGAGGGAASDLRTAATAIPAGTNLDTNPSIDTRILVAGGAAAGGVGTDRADLATTAGFLTTAEGGTGGNGTSSTQEGSGGGGGGYRGGGGGASGRREAGRTGSSYVHPSLLTDPHIQEKVHCGDGQVRILLLPPAI